MRRIRAVAWGATAVALFGMGAGVRADGGIGALDEGNVMTLQTRTLIMADGAYLFGKPELIAEQSAETPVLSPDGRALLVGRIRMHPPLTVTAEPRSGNSLAAGELDVILWDGRTRQSTVVYREPFPEDGAAYLMGIHWLPGSRVALIDVGRAKRESGGEASGRTLLKVDTAALAPAAHRLADIGGGDDVKVSPIRPIVYAMTFVQETGESSLKVIEPESARIREVALTGSVMPMRWTADGASVFGTRWLEKTPEGNWTRRDEITRIDLGTGQISHPSQAPAAYVAPDTPRKAIAALPVRLVNGEGKLSDEHHKAASLRTVWLEAANKANMTGGDPLLLATDAEGITLLSDGSAALVRRDGALYAIPIYKLSLEAYAAALRGAQKAGAISNLKQIGLAMLMYTQDYDENLPKNDGDIQNTIGPYLKNRDVFNDPSTGKNGFTFTYQGPSAFGQIPAVSETELGRLSGPGGHAVLYADGHVRWFDDPTPSP